MRFVLVNQHYAPDSAPTARLLSDVGDRLVASGHEVTVVCSKFGYSNGERIAPSREMQSGVDIRRVGGTRFPRRRRSARLANYFSFFLTAMVRLLTIRRVDAYICLSSPPLLAPLVDAVATIKGARFAYWIMDLHPDIAFALGHARRDSVSGRFLLAASKRTIKRANAAITLGELMASHVAELAQRTPEIVPNWADADLIEPLPLANHALREEWGWADKFVVSYSGNLGLAHEFDTVLGAANKLAGDPTVLFAFVGDGPRLIEVQTEAEHLNLPNVEFRPAVSDRALGRVLTAANLHLVTLRNEVAGLCEPSKTYGILAAGRPFVYVGPPGTEAAVLADQLDCGTRVPVGDVSGLVEAISVYRDHPELAEFNGARARHVFERNYTTQHGSASIVRIVTSALVAG